jgi:hypothetical protein
MGVLARYQKQSGERKRYQIDYSNWLDTGESVVGVVFTVNKATVPPLVIDGIQVTPNATGVQYYSSGGLTLNDYIVTATLTTSSGPQIKEDEIFFSVRDQ